jgi:hypothetical protein
MIKAAERKQNPLQNLLQHNREKEIQDQINKRKFETHRKIENTSNLFLI